MERKRFNNGRRGRGFNTSLSHFYGYFMSHFVPYFKQRSGEICHKLEMVMKIISSNTALMRISFEVRRRICIKLPCLEATCNKWCGVCRHRSAQSVQQPDASMPVCTRTFGEILTSKF